MGKIWPKENSQNKGIKLLLFLISPFISFLYSLKTMNSKSSYVIFFLFALFFGMSFTVNSDQINYIDGISYREKFEIYCNISLSEFLIKLRSYFTFDSNTKDLYYDVVAFSISRITNNYHVLFMFFSLIFVSFQLKTLRFFTTNKNFRNTSLCFILAFLFTYNGIFNINGVRFWTAALVAVYSIFQIFINNKKKYFLLAFITPFFHGSFYFFICIILLGYFTKRFEKIWTITFFVSFVLSNLSIGLFQDISGILPPFLQNLINAYTDAEYIKSINTSGSGFWIIKKVFNFIVIIYINYIIFLFIKNRNDFVKTYSYNLYRFLIVYITIVNIVMPIPSLGNRYIILSYPIIAYLLLENLNKYKNIILMIPIVFFMNIVNSVSLYMSVLSVDFFYMNPFFLFFKYIV